jgi:DNA repair protein RAD50
MNSNDGERYEKRASELDLQMKTTQVEVESLKPKLEQITKIVDDQERQKNNLLQNIELLESRKREDIIRQEIESLERKLSRVEGGDTCWKDKEALDKREIELRNNKASLKGRRNQLLEVVMGIKRKLSQNEYKDVDEQYRQANIKFDTTEMAAKDIEKCRTALDKALQEFHRKKINEINGIIKELWNLTYKGEDITCIKIVSGADANSRATKSYNYRVVMTKGITEMDMRGRCSAGQRVLASLVIRLALAQSFCVQCGCIALDEPTVSKFSVMPVGCCVIVYGDDDDQRSQ